nr:EOG090X0CQ9 [Eulimnadia texana]
MLTVALEENDQNLLQQFSCMGTTDHDVLILQLRKLIGEDVNEATASFFLDMNNWNLQAAICSYFEYQSNYKLPSMTFIQDVTIGEGESVPPNTDFKKCWRVANSGEERWPDGCQLIFTGGSKLSIVDRVPAPSLGPGEVSDLSVDMKSPEAAGIYQGKWRMMTSNGSYFGDTIWVIISVDEGGTLALTQQLNQFSALGSSPNSVLSNPFAVHLPANSNIQPDDTDMG